MESQSQIYQRWKPTVLGQKLNADGVKADTGQCSQVDISYGEQLFPGVPWYTLFPPTPSAKNFGSVHNPQYFSWVVNDHSNPNQLPEQGDIMVFDGTPQSGYANQTNNPDGHTGVCDSASPTGYILTQENAPSFGQGVNTTGYDWKFRPCLGWLHPLLPTPTTTIPNQPVTDSSWVGKTLYMHPVAQWHVYPVGAQPILSNALNGGKDYLIPKNYHNGPNGAPGLTYPILAVSKYPNTVTIQTDSYGRVDVYVDQDGQII